MPPSRAKFVVYKYNKIEGGSGFRWKLVVRGKTVAVSAQTFNSEQNARRSIGSLAAHMGARVVRADDPLVKA